MTAAPDTASPTVFPADTLSAVLRLDAHRPLLWRDPTTLQFGVDPVLAVLDNVDNAELRLIDTLLVGATRERLQQLAEHLGVSNQRLTALLDELKGALDASAATPRPPEPLAVVGAGVGAERVAAALAESGHPVHLIAPATRLGRTVRWKAAVLVSNHVIDPFEHARWLRRDIPHLPVIFGEAAVTVGPLVWPDASPCLACVERQRAHRDVARSALTAQLWGSAAATETPSNALESAVMARRMLRTRSTAMSLRLDAASAELVSTAWDFDPDCGCRGLTTRAVAAPRRGSDSARAPLATAPAG